MVGTLPHNTTLTDSAKHNLLGTRITRKRIGSVSKRIACELIEQQHKAWHQLNGFLLRSIIEAACTQCVRLRRTPSQ